MMSLLVSSHLLSMRLVIYCAPPYNASSYSMKRDPISREHYPSSLLINIRRQQRQAETEQLKNTLRFTTEISASLDRKEPKAEGEEVPVEVLEDCIEAGDYEAVFDAIIYATEAARETVEQHIEPVLEWIFARLALPTAALALERLLSRSDVAVLAIFEQGRFPELVGQLRRLVGGAREQNIYLSSVCEVLRRVGMVDCTQLGPLFSTLEDLFSRQMQEEAVSNFTVLAASRLLGFSSPARHFSAEFVIDFLDFFWRTEREINRTHIFLAAVELPGLRPYNCSLTVLFRLIRMLLHGREMIPPHVEAQAPSTPALLGNIFKFFNSNYERIEQKGVITVEGEKLSLPLHRFLLQYETNIFKNAHLHTTYMHFLLEFTKNAPVGETCEVWSNCGLLIRLIQKMPGMASEPCYTALQVCLTLLKAERVTAGQLLILYQIKEIIAELLQVGCPPCILHICEELLSILSGRDEVWVL